MLEELIAQLEAKLAEEKENNATAKSLQFIGDQRYNEGWEAGFGEALKRLQEYSTEID